MKLRSNLVGFIVGLLFFAPVINAGINLSSSGGVSVGTTPTGGTPTHILYTNAAGVLSGDAALTFDDSGAGNGSFIFSKTHVNVTDDYFVKFAGTLPALGSTVGANLIVDTTAGTGGPVYGIYSKLSAAAANSSEVAAIFGEIPSSAAVTAIPNMAGKFLSNTNSNNKIAIGVFANGICGNGCNIANNRNAGVVALGGAGGVGHAQVDYAVYGSSHFGSTNSAGGVFILGNQPSWHTYNAGVAALVADNLANAGSIFLAKDNGTTVFDIADGGVLTSAPGGTLAFAVDATSPYLVAGKGISFFGTGGLGLRAHVTAHSTKIGMNNMAGSFGGTNTDAFIGGGSHNTGNTGWTPRMYFTGGTGQGSGWGGDVGFATGFPDTTTSSTHNIHIPRERILGAPKALTAGSATNLVLVSLPVSSSASGYIDYSVYAADAVDSQSRSGRTRYQIINNAAGVETCVISPTTETTDDSSLAASSGTLTYTWDTDTTPTNGCNIRLNAVSSLTETTLQITYRFTLDVTNRTTTAVQFHKERVMRRLLFAFILIAASRSEAQETYTLNASATQVKNLNVVVNSVNDRTCLGLNLTATCTQAQACTASGISSSCTGAQARGVGARIYPLTQAGREEYVTFELVAKQFQLYFDATVDYNRNKYCAWFKAQTTTVKNAECSKSGAPNDCELCP